MAKRKFGLLVLILAFVTALSIGLVGCTETADEPGGNTSAGDSTNTVNYDLYGEYYTEVNGAQYTLSFTDKTYTMTLNDLGGEFEFDGTTLTLKGANAPVATISNQSITVTYNGTTYRFLKKVNYAVTFETDGGSTVNAASVLNGKTVAKPADPEKDGYDFVGWYADASFDNPFAFGATAITADTKVYARFVAKTGVDTEFTATFVDGNGGTFADKTTVGGKLYDLPTPTGENFAGWYVSDSDNADKLTYKYEDQILYSNVTLYAYYSDGTPQPSVSASGIKWSAAGAGAEYALTVVGPDSVSYGPYNLSSTEYKFNFADKAEGEYAVTLTVKGVKKTAYFTNKGLAKVSVFSADGYLFRYNSVPNAEKYYISVDCGNNNHNHDAFDNGNSLYYDFSGCTMQEGGIAFTVTAVAEGYVSSVSETYYVDRSLAPITGFAISDGSVTWNAVDGADYYTVEITQGNDVTTVNVGKTTGYSLQYYSGEMTVKVYAQKKDYNSSSTEEYYYNKSTLATPNGFTMQDRVLSWNAVDGATKYELTVNGKAYMATTNSFSLSSDNGVASANEYAVTVKAVASSAANNSKTSETVTVVAGETDDVISYANGYVYWNPVLRTNFYEVKINDGEPVQVTNANSYKVNFTRAGNNTVYVRHNYGSNRYTNWVSVNVRVYAIEFDVKGGAPVATTYKAIGDDFDLPKTVTLGYDFAGWYTVPGGASVNGKKYEGGAYDTASDITLYAFYTPKTYTVALDTTSGIGDNEANVSYDSAYVLPVPTPNDVAMGFAGWYTEPYGNGLRYTNELGESLDNWRNVGEVTLYAHWISYFEFLPIENGNAWSVMGTAGVKNSTYIKVPATYLGKPVKIVDGAAFISANKLEKIEIPNTVTLIEVDTAFSNCQNLKEVVIYDAKAEYPDDEVIQDAEVGTYYTVDGVIFQPGESDPAPEIKFFPRGKEGRYVIPDGTAVITANVFTQAKITEVVIPSSVTQIQANAFSYCKLVEVTFVDGNDDLPLTISAKAFSSCEGLTTITFPKRLTSFDNTIFKYCKALEAVNIDGDGGTYTSLDGVVLNADGTEILYVPVAFKGVDGNYDIPVGVTKIAGGAVATADGDTKNGGAFSGCTALKSVAFHGNVIEIGENAFRLSKITEIVFEGNTKDGVSLAIKEGAFYGCSRLKEVVLPNYLNEIGANAFYGCTGLKTVTIASKGNVDFAAGSFLGYNGNGYVETVNIGKDVCELELTGIFGTKVVNVNIDENNPNYTVIDGVIYDPNVTKLLYYPLGKTGNFTFPSTVSVIGNNVFQYKSNLTEVHIPNTITTIGVHAFEGCENLTTITFDNNRTSALTIGDYAFAKLPVEEIVLPEMTTEIGNGAFSDSALLTISIPASVTKMGTYDASGNLTAMSVFEGSNDLYSIAIAAGNESFYTDAAGVLYLTENGEAKELVYAVKGAIPAGVTSSSEVTVPSTVTRVWDKVFENNNKITKITFSTTEPMTLGNSIFYGAKALREVTLSTGFTSIPKETFYACSSIESIDIPYTVTSIGTSAFMDCVSLTTINFTGDRLNESGAVAYPLTIADGTSGASGGSYKYYQFRSGVFVGCLNLKNLVLPEGTTKIGQAAFAIGDTAIDEYFAKEGTDETPALGLESIYIPSTVTSVGAAAFSGIPVEDVRYKRSTSTANEIGDIISGLKTVTFAPNCNFTLSNNMFSYSNIESITIPKSVTTIPGAFYGTKNLKTLYFEEGSAINTISASAFISSGLETVTFPATVKSIGMSAFKFCRNLTTVNFEVNASGNSALVNTSAGRPPVTTGPIGSQAFAYTGLTSITFPKAASPYLLGANLFEGCENLTTVSLPVSINNLDNVFAGNKSVQQINVADGNTLTLENDADHQYVIIYSTSAKTNISLVLGNLPEHFTIPETVTQIGVRAFDGHTELKSVTIPSRVTSVGERAFNECTNLKNVIFEGAKDGGLEAAQLTNLGIYAFYGCKSLESVVLPNSLTKVSAHSFENCSSLASVTLGNAVTQLMGYCFAGSGIESITLPDTVTEIGKLGVGATGGKNPDMSKEEGHVFYNCANLTSITFEGQITTIGYYAFAGCASLTSFEIPSTVTNIASHAFDGTGLTSIVIPSYVILGSKSTTDNGVQFDDSTGTNIDTSVFANCPALASVTFTGDVDALMLPGYLFNNCPSLTEVKFVKGDNTVTNSLPEYVTYVGDYVFAGTGITEFEFKYAFPDTFGAGFFSNAKNLEKVTLYRETEFVDCSYSGYNLGMTNTARGNAAMFEGCESLTEIGYYDYNGKYVSGELPETVMVIPYKMFAGCTNLVNLKLSTYVVEMGSYAFSGCKNWTANDGVINLPKGFYIMPYTFEDCDAVTTVVINSDNGLVMTIANQSGKGSYNRAGITAFTGMDSLVDFIVPASLGFIIDNGLLINDGVVFMAFPALINSVVEIPEDVTEIALGAFQGNETVTRVIFNNVQYIGQWAFRGCTNLEVTEEDLEGISYASNSF